MKNKIYKSIVLFDKEVAIKWCDGKESFINLILLRKACPCAWCSGEKDVFGNVYKGQKKTLPSHAYIINSYEEVGLYGLRLFWKDGHSDGIYTVEKMKALAFEE